MKKILPLENFQVRQAPSSQFRDDRARSSGGAES